MKCCRQFFIDGKWVSPTKAHDFQVINPANEQPIATISLGTLADVMFSRWANRSGTLVSEKAAKAFLAAATALSTLDEMAETISTEMGAPH